MPRVPSHRGIILSRAESHPLPPSKILSTFSAAKIQPMQPPFVDFHCHPALKPYGHCFLGRKGRNDNSTDRYSLNSIWHYEPPRLIDRGLQAWAGICKFSQADCSTLSYGNSRIVCASLYPVERGFFKNSLGENCVNDYVNAFVASVGRERVESIRGITNYFEDMCGEYEFYKQLDGKPMEIEGETAMYRLVRNWAEIDKWSRQEDGDKTIFFIMTIEGLHALNRNMDAPPDRDSFLENVRAIKAWDHPPFFVTLAHHFNNHVCGHAKSLFELVGKVSDQSEGVLTGFTDLGRDVLREVLSRENGRRMLVDIKHMSPQARKEYFTILKAEYAGEQIPVIASHAAANGLRSMDEPVSDNPALAEKLLAEGINFYDDEILMIARTGGIFGLQLDERRAASKAALKSIKHSIFLNQVRHYRAGLLWYGIQYVAELLDKHDLPAWDCMALGTDFDATIDPLNGFLTAEHLPHLQSYLERHAYNYMSTDGKKLKPQNQITSNAIVHKIFTENGMRFLQKWF
jgi:microsomal dipeptidase-like Zn-dependent dipeptidase